MEQKLLTVKEAAVLLRISASKLYQLVRAVPMRCRTSVLVGVLSFLKSIFPYGLSRQ